MIIELHQLLDLFLVDVVVNGRLHIFDDTAAFVVTFPYLGHVQTDRRNSKRLLLRLIREAEFNYAPLQLVILGIKPDSKSDTLN